MDAQRLLDWYRELDAEGERLRSGKSGQSIIKPHLVSDWITRAQSALDEAFPPAHAVQQQWGAMVRSRVNALLEFRNGIAFSAAHGVFKGALKQVEAGRLDKYAATIRTDTVGEVLDLAEDLLQDGHLVAAAVLAGGALETHLHHLCIKHEIRWDGDGSLGAYRQALDTARANGLEVVSSADCKSIGGWADIRNDAAHKPTQFSHTKRQVELMIDGIRDVLARVA